ncbi:hypothetical protein SOVF_176780, partial [Spinacia oleracea]
MVAAAKHLTPIILELGGKFHVVVDSDVNMQVVARRIIAGKWSCNNGQTCTTADYVITTKDFAPKLIDALRSELDEFFRKDHLDSNDMSRVVSLYHFKRLMKLMEEDGVSDKIVLGGHTDATQLWIRCHNWIRCCEEVRCRENSNRSTGPESYTPKVGEIYIASQHSILVLCLRYSHHHIWRMQAGNSLIIMTIHIQAS